MSTTCIPSGVLRVDLHVRMDEVAALYDGLCTFHAAQPGSLVANLRDRLRGILEGRRTVT